ncbi:hypothetical protein BGW36DRAFT_390215 [Talaromyces proteolyticus]|uniref:Uncharacterized protein n=1 Tax=Talaromyces proteolyticus TaxID=1131652 RepID=A0AAD4PUH1_9EURO|nr:uncharacterized protein BGW36DRAFT_390215 [Talaromyces proteolyticus]KAH8690102.1 hypothetical protein BGW36DRAFT_390215 [Talaromyces proteolyticus]
MRRFLDYLFLLWLPLTVFAKDDPDYRPWSNFRPKNVTGLTGLYAWVGSYYNASTEIDFKPLIGVTFNDTLCPNLKGFSGTKKVDSILTIAERGPYNSGKDSLNLWLTLIPPNYNLSSVPYDSQIPFSSPLIWPILSSELTWKQGENTTVPDNFNFTVSKTQQGSYNLSGTMQESLSSEDVISTVGNVTMSSCNSTEYTDDWRLDIWTYKWWDNQGWDAFTFPSLDVQFDNNTANLTLNGYFIAQNFVRTNATDWIGPQEVGSSIQGSIQIRFSGVIDAYHSDVMNLTGQNPVWLRTVGFGNNSLNIDNTGGAGSGPYPALAIVATGFIGCVVSMYI